MNGKEKVRFTKEELTKRIQVPPVVEHDLKRIITDRMEQCGLYFRVFSRVKTASSMEHKFSLKEYGGEKKLQDLIGVRINLYFDDDMDICRYIMEHTFELVGWSTTEQSADEFKPTKLNGVFRLPEYLRNEISDDTWEMSIDDTFEIQIKTIFFEGWHEIEHDMRYKGEELWRHYPKFSRYLNSILATLELCDKSMVTLFDDLGHALYKAGRWSDMIKNHFRLKIGDAPLYPEVEELLNADLERVDNLAKRIYKTKKLVLIDQLLRRSRRVPINVNTIIALLNECKFHDSRLTAIFRQRDVYNDGREDSLAESRHYELRPLQRHTVFQMCTEVDGSRMETEQPPDAHSICEACARQIYGWIVQKYGVLFKDMPAEPATFHADILAYHVAVNLDRERGVMNMHVRHMDPDVGGRIWYSEASLERTQEQRVLLKLSNGYAQAEQEDRPVREGAGIFFSYPGYYKTIVDTIGIFNGLPCSNRRRIIRREQIPGLLQAMDRRDRKFPIVLIVSREGEDGLMEEDWLGQFRVSDFTRTVWRYAHVLTCYEEVGRELLPGLLKSSCLVREEACRKTAEAERTKAPEAEQSAEHGAAACQAETAGNAGAVLLDLPEIRIPGMYLFWPDGDVDVYGPEDVRNCSFGRHLEARSDARTYDIVRGGQALYHKVVTDLRDWNVSDDMWEGFKLEIMTEIPG